MRKDDKIKDVFSSKFSNFEPSVPSDMWNRIEQNLPETSVAIPPQKVPLLRYIATVAGVAAAIFIGVIFINQTEEHSLQITTTSPVETKKDTPSTYDTVKEKPEHSNSSPVQNNIQGQYSIFSHVATNKNVQSPAHSETQSKDNNNAQPIEADVPVIADSNTTDKQPNTSETTKNTVDQKTLQQQLEELEALSQGKQSLLAHNTPAEKAKKNKDFTLSLNGGSGLASESNNNILIKNPLSTIVANSDALTTYTDASTRKGSAVDMDHRQPISFGLTISKNITDKLSIETGIIYTYLSSKIKGKKPEKYRRADNQHFHYLGIPLTVNYTFAEWGKAEFYTSTGGMIQKDIAGKMKGNSKVLNELGDKEAEFNEKISQDHVQLSINAAVGASYPLYKNLYVFTTVGGVYYFEANNEYKTIYSDKKLQLDIDLGLKVKF